MLSTDPSLELSKAAKPLITELQSAQNQYLKQGYTGFLLLEHGETPLKLTKTKQGGPLIWGAKKAARRGLSIQQIVDERAAGYRTHELDPGLTDSWSGDNHQFLQALRVYMRADLPLFF